MLCHCGTTLYRSLDGELHCIRCESRNDLCSACDGRTFRMRGKVMKTCEICAGTGYRPKTVAPTSGPSSETLMGGCCSGVYDVMEVYGYPAAVPCGTGRPSASDTKRRGG